MTIFSSLTLQECSAKYPYFPWSSCPQILHKASVLEIFTKITAKHLEVYLIKDSIKDALLWVLQNLQKQLFYGILPDSCFHYLIHSVIQHIPANLTHSFPMHPSLPPENIRKPYSFLMFPGNRERVHWERMC